MSGKGRTRGLEAALALLVGLAVLGMLQGADVRPARDRTKPTPRPVEGPVLFPGGGRLLVVAGGGLLWVGADGTISDLAAGVEGASLVSGGAAILAWRQTSMEGAAGESDYFAIDVETGDELFRLEAEPRERSGPVRHVGVTLSPGGSAMAYERRVGRRPGELIVQGPGTVIRLGRAPQEIVWMPRHSRFGFSSAGDSAGLAVPAAGNTEVVSLGLDGSRATLVRADDPRAQRAFARAVPGRKLVHVTPLSWSPDGTVLSLRADDGRGWGADALMMRHDGGPMMAFPFPKPADVREVVWGGARRFVVSVVHRRYPWWCCPPRQPTHFLAGTLDRPGELRLVLRTIPQFAIVSAPVVSPDGSTMTVERPLFGGDQDWLFLPLEGATRPCSHHGEPAPAGRFGSDPNCRGATIVTEDWIIGGLAGWAPA